MHNTYPAQEYRMLFNVNNTVKVRLTEHGMAQLKLCHIASMRTSDGEFIPPSLDEQGYSSWRLNELMYYFGNDCFSGSKVMPFENVIKLLDDQ